TFTIPSPSAGTGASMPPAPVAGEGGEGPGHAERGATAHRLVGGRPGQDERNSPGGRGRGGRGVQGAAGPPVAGPPRPPGRLPRRWSGWCSRIAQDAEVGQDTPHDSGIVDRRDHAHAAPAVRTGEYIDGKDALEQIGPAPARRARGGGRLVCRRWDGRCRPG